MRSKFPNHARNVWDRAVALLPRVDQFWYKYSYMEVRKGQRAKALTSFPRARFGPVMNPFLSIVSCCKIGSARF